MVMVNERDLFYIGCELSPKSHFTFIHNQNFKMKIIRTIAMVVLVALTGCASFPGKVLPKVAGFPTTTDKPSVRLSLTFRQYMNEQPINFAVKSAEARLQSKLITRLTGSGLYSSVSVTNQNPDITITVQMDDKGSGSMGMAFLTGLTLYIVPSSATDLYKVSAKVCNHRTGVEGVVELEDFVTQWQQILLLPLLPFTMSPVVANGVQNNLMDTLAIRVHEVAASPAPKSAILEIATPASTTPGTVQKNPPSEDVVKRLKILKEAHDAGLISDEEFTAKKSDLIKGF